METKQPFKNPPDQEFIVVASGDVFERVLHGLPSPLLVEQGGGEAYLEDGYFWRLRDDQYDPNGTIYRKVRIIRKKLFRPS